jgi:hypothetical protein
MLSLYMGVPQAYASSSCSVVMTSFNAQACCDDASKEFRIFDLHRKPKRSISDLPVILVQTKPSEYHLGKDFLPVSYVNNLEAQGAVVVPVPSGMTWYMDDDETKRVKQHVQRKKMESYAQFLGKYANGYFHPGGNPWPMMNSSIVPIIQNIIKNRNDNGEPVPIWGTCAGFEFEILETHRSCLDGSGKYYNKYEPNIDDCILKSGFDSENQVTSVEIDRELLNSGQIPGQYNVLNNYNIISMLEGDNVYMNHYFGINATDQLPEYHKLGYSYDRNGRKYVSMIQHKKYPNWIGTQFHPEKPLYVYGVKDDKYALSIPHHWEARQISMYVRDWFVQLSRETNMTFPLNELMHSWIHSYKLSQLYRPEFPDTMGMYMFDWQNLVRCRGHDGKGDDDKDDKDDKDDSKNDGKDDGKDDEFCTPFLRNNRRRASSYTHPSDHIALGFEVETCTNHELRPANFTLHRDRTIKCEHGTPAEYVYDGAFSAHDIAVVLNGVKEWVKSTSECDPMSCGTHLHMSQRGIPDTAETRNLVLVAWLKIQNDTFNTYYGIERPRAPMNDQSDPRSAKRGYEPMLNFRPTTPGQPLHLEFRGYPQIQTGSLPKFEAYLHYMVEFWEKTALQILESSRSP